MNATNSIISSALSSILKTNGKFFLSNQDIWNVDLRSTLAIGIDDTGYELKIIETPQHTMAEVFSYKGTFKTNKDIKQCVVSKSCCAAISGKDITFWDIEKERKCRLFSNDSEIKWAKYTAHALFTLSADHRLQMWSQHNDKQIGEISLGSNVHLIDVSSCGKWLVAHSSNTWAIELWSIPEKRLKWTWRISRADLRHLFFNTGNEQELMLVFGGWYWDRLRDGV